MTSQETPESGRSRLRAALAAGAVASAIAAIATYRNRRARQVQEQEPLREPTIVPSPA